MAKTALSKSAVIGGTALYRIVVINSSNADTTNVTLEDRLPFQLWPLIALSCTDSIISTQGHCFYTDQTSTGPIKVYCDLVTLAAGERAVITYAAQPAARAQPGEVSNLITVKSDQSTLTAVKETVNLVGSSGISDEELNEILGLARSCGTILSELPFLDLVNLLVDQLSRQEITGIEVQSALVAAALDLVALRTHNREVGQLGKLFSIPDCVRYGGLLFSIGLPVQTAPEQCPR